ALGLGHPPERARALAAAVVILDAVEAGPRADDDGTARDPDTTDLLRGIGAVSRALRRPDDLRTVRARADRTVPVTEGRTRRGGRNVTSLGILRGWPYQAQRFRQTRETPARPTKETRRLTAALI